MTPILKIKSARLKEMITADRRRSTKSLNQSHPDTKGWEFLLQDNGILGIAPSGYMVLIPFSNIIEMEVEYAEGASSSVFIKKKGK